MPRSAPPCPILVVHPSAAVSGTARAGSAGTVWYTLNTWNDQLDRITAASIS